ncbi:autophagy protein 5 isoform X2 [Sitodiplosis mosellana]|uniref:autophagy protein 5 isoform X2 n=1 Tax=Sitodiplosis mosellana TaxID=263140 RepID=UPI00244418E1|nr:autophagy protein 5 isoform X2 [Sitodiplosis mosellana]
MANDREVLRIIWEGQIPICFQADLDEANAVRQPENFYLMVSRLSYLPLVTDKVKKHFSRFVSNEAQEGEVWFDSNGLPLKWHYPIGVLYELTKLTELPWCITIHFSKFPEEILFRCPNREIVESHFMSCLKEADVLKHRGQVVSRMQKKDHNQLWLGLVNDKFDQFWSVNRRLMEPTSEDGFKYIPIRCYKEDGTYVQKLVPPNSDNGFKRTVQHLLEDFSTSASKAVTCLTHGIEIEKETPLQWLSEHMSYPDNFLHVHLIWETLQETIA